MADRETRRARRLEAEGERRMARRLRAKALWESDLAAPGARFRAWLNMMAVDHGILRVLYLNLHRVGDRAWRSAQPTPRQIERLARRGLRSVIFLRGGVLFGSYALERETCRRLGLDFRRSVLRSRGLPSREELRDLRALMEEVETPVLFHCKSGADRAGFMAALWMIHMEGASVETASRQLSLRYGHLNRGPTGVLDRFFAAAAEAEARGVPFEEWVETEYDRDAMLAAFKSRRRGPLGRIAGWVTDRLLKRE